MSITSRQTHSMKEIKQISHRYELRILGYATVGGLNVPVFVRRTSEEKQLPDWVDEPFAEVDMMDSSKTRRIARLHKNGGGHTTAEWIALCEQFNFQCVRCKRTGIPLTKDHIVPVLHGGKDNISNLQPLCINCNSIKGARTEDYRDS